MHTAATLPSQVQAEAQWSAWVDVAFRKLDRNGDGFISLGELLLELPGSADSGEPYSLTPHPIHTDMYTITRLVL
jgi:hypothetical protein